MIEITKDNLQDLEMNGIIVGIPKVVSVETPQNDLKFVFECVYFTNGEHGYPTEGESATKRSFYECTYNTELLKKGLYFDSDYRCNLNEIFAEDYTYYKFTDMKEFCMWYLDYISTKQQRPVVKHTCSCHTPKKRVDKYADIIELIDFKLNLAHLDADIQAAEQQRKSRDVVWQIIDKYNDMKAEYDAFLQKEV